MIFVVVAFIRKNTTEGMGKYCANNISEFGVKHTHTYINYV